MTIPIDERGQLLEKIVKKCSQYLTHLTIKDDEYDSWVILYNAMKDNFQNIIHVDIDKSIGDRNQEITHENFIEMIKSMPKLKYFRRRIFHEVNATGLCTQILDILPDNMEEIRLIAHTSSFNFDNGPELPPVIILLL